MKLLSICVLITLGIIIVWNIQARKSVGFKNSRHSHQWFAALKHGNTEVPGGFTLAEGVSIPWQVQGDLAFIGSQGVAPYWDRLLLLGSETEQTAPMEFSDQLDDVYLVRLKAYEVPALGLSLFSALHKLGIWSTPSNLASRSPDLSLIRADIGPTQESVDALFARPFDQQAMMINFVKFYERAHYPDDGSEPAPNVGGREAYDRYGDIANKAAYSVGGQYVLGGYITEVLQAAKGGPTIGDWDDIAVMQYPNQTAILAMEQIDEYRQALKHRNAGLERTVIISGIE